MEELTYGGMALSVIILSIVQALKTTGLLKKQWAGITSILLGVVLGLVLSAALEEVAYAHGALAGLLSGVLASGLYSNVKTMREVHSVRKETE